MEMSLESKTFVLSYLAIIWKQILSTIHVYCKHNNVLLNSDVVKKVMKYGIYSKSGIYENIKPYLAKAIEDGFLMPNFYRQNEHSKEAVKLFSLAYKVVQKHNQNEEIKFIKEYSKISKNTDNVKGQIIDGKCICDLCQTIESWDINLDLLSIDSGDDYQDKMMKTLLLII